jgi:dTDP-4-amino-4,6-dideoxygalactose transaminase
LLADLSLTIPFEDGLGTHVYHQYTLLSSRRDEIIQALQREQIGCAIYYPVPLHKQNVFKNEYAEVCLPVTERVALECFSIPICPFLDSDSVEKITTTIANALH